MSIVSDNADFELTLGDLLWLVGNGQEDVVAEHVRNQKPSLIARLVFELVALDGGISYFKFLESLKRKGL